MKLRKLFAVVLCAVMVLTVCGCGEKKENTSGNNENLSTEEVDSATFEGLKFDIDKDLDFGGKTVTIARNIVPDWGISENYDRELTIKEYVEEKYNVKIEYLKYTDDTFVNDLVIEYVSGSAMADIVFSTSPNLLSALTNEGIFRAVDDYIDFSNDRFELTDSATKYVDGKHYSYYPIKNDAGYFVYYNTELLTANNCEDPLELYESGNWNWDAFEKIAKACNGVKNGKIIYGLAGSNILDGLMSSNGMSVVSADVENSKAKCNLFTDAGKNVLEFVRTLAYTDKAVDGTYGGHNGIETFNNSYTAMLIGPQYYGSHLVSTGIPFEMVPMPLGPDTDTYTNVCQYCYCYSVSANSEYDTEDLLQLVFELERNDPAIGDTYQENNYEGRLQAFIDQYVDQENHYIDDTQAQFVYDFINDEKTVNKIDWVTEDIKKVIAEKIYVPISTGEDVRSHLTSVEPVITAALDEQF